MKSGQAFAVFGAPRDKAQGVAVAFMFVSCASNFTVNFFILYCSVNFFVERKNICSFTDICEIVGLQTCGADPGSTCYRYGTVFLLESTTETFTVNRLVPEICRRDRVDVDACFGPVDTYGVEIRHYRYRGGTNSNQN